MRSRLYAPFTLTAGLCACMTPAAETQSTLSSTQGITLVQAGEIVALVRPDASINNTASGSQDARVESAALTQLPVVVQVRFADGEVRGYTVDAGMRLAVGDRVIVTSNRGTVLISRQ